MGSSSQQTAFGSSVSRRILVLSSIAASVYWVADSLLTQRESGGGHLVDYLLPGYSDALWMRLLISGLLIGLGAYAQRLFNRFGRASAQITGLLEGTTDAYLAVDRQWRIRYLNGQAERLFGVERGSALKAGLWDLLPEVASSFYRPLTQAAERRTPAMISGYYPAADRWLELHVRPDGDGLALHVRDVTERQHNEEALRHSGRRLETILDSTVDGIVTIDRQGRIDTFNSAAQQMFGYTAEEIRGENIARLMPAAMSAEHDGHITDYLRSGVSQVLGLGPRESVARRRDGSEFPVDLAISEMRLGDELHFVGIIRDITEQKRDRQQLEYMSSFDALTGLPNRTLLRDRLAHALAQAHREEHLLAVMFLDLDHFKKVNDSLGHAMGDELLKEVSRRLLGCVRETDTVARLGGDEFVVVLDRMTHVDNAAAVAQKIIDALTLPVNLGLHEVVVGTSIGITIYPFDDDNVDDLLKDADTAMYRAKAEGRNNYQYFTADMTQSALEHMRLEQDLRHAMERNEFELHYQPQVELASERVIGVEALLRWNHPSRGRISPGDFVPILEDSGLILEVGEWVLREACRQARRWQREGLPPVRMAVNLSARQFRQPDLAGAVLQALADSGLEPSQLELEITEGLLVENVTHATEVLEELDAMGVRLSIDDFGTGYSSMNYLKRFPLHTLKIDRSFVQDVTDDADSATIAEAIIGLAHSLWLRVIAEGVETAEQLEFLRERGCDEVQGFFFSRPMPPSEVVEWLRARDAA